jgi:glycosyltransferase involved in cell wall biosynthesis
MSAIQGSEFLLVGHHFAHHSAGSGYDQLARFADADYLDLTDTIVRRRWSGYRVGPFKRLAAQVRTRRAGSGRRLVHFLYAENVLSRLVVRSGVKTVVTLHHPFDFYYGTLGSAGFRRKWLLRSTRAGLAKVDGIVLLTPTELDRFCEAHPRAVVEFIPHGINDNSGVMPTRRDDELKLQVCVLGYNYRDVDLLQRLLRRAGDEGRDWQFHLIGMGSNAGRFHGIGNHVRVYGRLDDSSYLGLLASCDVNLLPLVYATANNALLEAHSTGTPTLISALREVDPYCVSTTQRFDGIEDLMHKLTAHPRGVSVDDMRRTTLLEARRFHWPSIADETRRLYSRVLSH